MSVTSIAVTGAAGALGVRVLDVLSGEDDVTRVVAIDRRSFSHGSDKVQTIVLDLMTEEVSTALLGCESVIHLAEGSGRVADHNIAEDMLGRLLDGAEAARCHHLVLLSSAMVYGAEPNNPVPLTEANHPAANNDLAFVKAKKGMESIASTWAAGGRTVAILRPTTALSDKGTSWVARAMRDATRVRSDQVDPPIQFLHYDDLASAASTAALSRLSGKYNVAPDGWIGSEAFHDLVGPQFRMPVAATDTVLRIGRRLGMRPAPSGIEPYVRNPWVVSNDKLKAAGWRPAYTNEESYVLGTDAPFWVLPPQRRSEAVLAVAVLGLGAVAAGAATIGRRLVK